MTVSLTATDSTSTNPPTPNDMTSTTASPSPPVPQSSALVGIDHASSPSSLIDKEQEEEASTATAGGIVEPVTAESVVSPSSVEATKSMALGEPNHGTGDETEDETANECDDEVGHVIKGDSDCKVNKRRSRDSATTDASSSEHCHEELSNDEPAPVSADTCAEKGAISSESDHRPQVTGTEGKSPTSERTTPANDFYTFKSESDPMSGDVAEMARMRAAKFIQERTKMACVLNSTAETEHLKQAANAPHLANSGNQGGGGGGGGSGSRKRKLTVKDILVSQRNRESGGKQQRVHESSSHSNSNNATSNNFPLNHMFPGLGSMMEPSLHGNEGNPFAAISAALAAAAATNNGAVNNAPPSGHLQLPDSQSAYISTLASSLSSANGNPTATLALMASLSAMMQHSKESNEGAANAASNPLVSLESTLANVMASNFGQHNPQQPHRNCSPNDDDEDVDEEDDHRGEAPVDFSLKTFAPKDVERPNSRRKSRKKVNGESGSSEDTEIPLDLSVAPKRPEESSPSKHENPLAAMFAQVPSMDGANGSNFAAMAAAAAAAAAASFSPNLLTKMASSMNPWSGFAGMQGLNSNNNNNNNKMGNDAAAAFNVLFQQMQNNNNANSSNKGNPTSLSSANPANLFQSFPDLYWNGGKLSSSKVSTASPSFGGLGNSTSLSSRHHHHHQPPPAASQPMRTKSSSGRQNPWQAQWINRSSEQTRDVFTCVWCKESFKSLAEMTDHMKRSPRCGMAGMQQHHSHHHNSQTAPGTPGHQHGTSAGNHQGPGGGGGQSTGKMSSSSSMSSPPVNPLSMALKESASHHGNSSGGNSSMERGGKSASGVTMPRKLVRGQDVWLGRGAEQTRQILKCMWCGQSFKSLADMTHHMKITQHYTNIISQEQITSWRTPDEKIAQAQVSAVLTCKVCDEAFGTLKELSNHMVKNAHFKEGGNTRDSSGRSTPTSVSAAVASSASGSRNGSTSGGLRPTATTTAGSTTPGSSDRRKKSLPVRKLLELERGEFSKRSPDDDETDESPKSPKSIASQLIECDDCHEKIEPRCFLTHIKQCRARNAAKSDAESEKSKADSEKTPGDEAGGASQSNFDSKKGESKNGQGKESEPEEGKPESNGKSAASGEETGSGSSGSVLSALEKLIEKNFDNKSRRTQQTGILQRLGIDEEVFPPWQNMAPSPLSAMSPTMAAWSASLNGLEAFSRSNSSSSNASNRVNNSCPSGGQAIPQLRYRRNSSSTSLKDKFLSGLGGPMKVATESNGSFSSQETEEEESCDESVNSDCGSSARRSQKRPLYSSRAQEKAARGLNFPISSMLSSPLPVRPTSASSTASSISPSSEPPITPTNEQLHRMTPSSHRSGQDEDEEDHEMGSPLALCKRPHLETDRKRKLNGASEEADDGAEKSSERPHSHNPLLQLQKLLDKTNTTGRHSSGKGGSNSNQRMSPFAGWTDSASMKAPSPASSPRTPPIHSPSSASAKSDEASYLMLKCAFCDTQIASRASYRAHLAKVHLAMRDSVDLSPVSDEELLLLVLAKNSSLSLMPGGNSGLLAAAAASAKVSPRAKESASKRKSKAAAAERASWDKSPNHPTSSPSASPALETSQSKFLKYAELAKQLSSKYA